MTRNLRVAALVSLICAAPALAQRPQTGTSVPSTAPPWGDGPTVLYNQDDNCGANSWTSQEFEAAFNTFDNQGADDFTIPAPDLQWDVTSVFARGVYFNGAGPTPLVDVQFLADSGGLPGAVVCDRPDLNTFADAAGSLTIALSAPCSLAAGATYWVSVRADMDFLVGGQWGWTERTVQSGSPAAWINPLGGFGVGCTSWGVRTSCLGAGGADNCFSVSGNVIPVELQSISVE